MTTAVTRKRDSASVPVLQEGEVTPSRGAKCFRPASYDPGAVAAVPNLLPARVTMASAAQTAELRVAVRDGDLDGVKRLLAAGVDPNLHASDLPRLIEVACTGENIEIVKTLTQHGAEVNFADGVGETPLHRVIEEGNVLLAEALLLAGAKVNARDLAGDTPMHNACITGSSEMVKLLLKHGANLELAGVEDKTPLEIAVDCGEEEVVELLCASGAEVNVLGSNGESPLHGACFFVFLGVAKVLLAHGDKVALPNKEENTSLHFAILHAGRQMVELLCNEGCDVEENKGAMLNGQGESPVHLATEAQDRSVVEFLCKFGFSVNLSEDAERNTPLHLAAQEGFWDIARLLLEHGADTTLLNDNGVSAAYLAHCKVPPSDLIPKFPLLPMEQRLISTKILAQVFGCTGMIPYGENEIELGGAYSPWFHQLIALGLAGFDQTEEGLLIADGFARALMQTPAEALAQIQSGGLTIVQAGWQGHAITLCFFDGYLAVCNRGEGSESHNNIEVFQIDQALVTEGIYLEIGRFKKCSAVEGGKYLYKTLPKKLNGGVRSQDDISAHFAEIENQGQKAENCAYAAPIAALRFALGMLGMKKAPAASPTEVLAAAKAESKRMASLITAYAFIAHSGQTLPGFYNAPGVVNRINTRMRKINPAWRDLVGEDATGQPLVLQAEGGSDDSAR